MTNYFVSFNEYLNTTIIYGLSARQIMLILMALFALFIIANYLLNRYD